MCIGIKYKSKHTGTHTELCVCNSACGEGVMPDSAFQLSLLAISQAVKCYFPLVFLFTVGSCNLCDFTVSLRNLQSAGIPAKPKVYLWRYS